MKRLTPLASLPSFVDRYVGIRNKKQLAVRNPLIAAHAFIQERYQALNAAVAGNLLHEVSTDARGDAIKTALRACYDVPTKLLRELKAEIVAAQPTRLLKYCPMCGTTLHSTFDHYLPAVRFPEFAVHALNLVPCCSKCNSIKDDDWLTEDGQRQYLHAFADEIPEVAFLTVTLHEKEPFTGVGATFSLVRAEGIPDNTWNLIVAHFERLHLLARYSSLSNDEIAEILADCSVFASEGGGDAASFLRRRAAERFGIHGRNHWRALLMHSLANHEKLPVWIGGTE